MPPKAKQSTHMTDFVRQCLREHPDGALSKDVYEYCVQRGAPFVVKEPTQRRLSIAAQLSYLNEKGEATFEVVENLNLWKSVRARA